MTPVAMTPRRRLVADMLVEGLQDREIAARLGCSVDAAKALVRDVRRWADADNRTEAAVRWDRYRRELA